MGLWKYVHDVTLLNVVMINGDVICINFCLKGLKESEKPYSQIYKMCVHLHSHSP